jgi:type IV pilus assembly protein PilZ|mmetsp:Transcript_1423/g.4258  ORF Transcript_1423/g.4258 Transcript_1423/m.4258 type:complete len:149 (-) Transcript_1423:278-724(-)
MSDATSKPGPSTQFQPSQIGGPMPLPSVGGLGAASGARPSVIQLVFREKSALYAAYIPAFTDGGLFVPTTRDYKLGEDVYLLLALPDDNQRYPVAGKVAWLTPANASAGRTQGVGVRFPGDEKTRLIRLRIEEILGTAVSSSKPTQTL